MLIGSQLIRSAVILLGFIFCLPLMGVDRDKATPLELGPFFVDEVWGKVGELSCLKCHNSSGEAKDSGFILQKTIPLQGVELQNTHVANFKAFSKMAVKRKPGQRSRLLLKPIGELGHEGKQVLKSNSTGLQILERFVTLSLIHISEPTRPY